MLFGVLPSRWLLAVAVLALPLTGGGCGRRACFTWSAREGVCPAQSEALTFFSTPGCPGQITSVESAPTNELDGALCCYEVLGTDQVHEPSCQGFGGSNSGGVSTGFEKSSGFAVSTSGGQGGSTPCANCAEAFNNLESIQLCGDTTAILVKTLFSCACDAACATPCGDNFCPGNKPSPECNSCLEDSIQGCGDQLIACVNDS